ncbi:MAG: hypothetical protein SWX82_22670 [Cyanobacteriota bacterium]|nr:hypothetical protein [Cyanobacteriota bacterium]
MEHFLRAELNGFDISSLFKNVVEVKQVLASFIFIAECDRIPDRRADRELAVCAASAGNAYKIVIALPI